LRTTFLPGLVLTLVLSSAAASAETLTFTPSTDDILNPDRGVTLLMDVGPGSLSTLDSMRANGYTIAWGMVRLNRSQVLAGSTRLTEIRTWLERVRTARLKAVIRLVYHEDASFNSANEPTFTQASAHLDALAATFSDYDDVILAHQLGVYGAYGEWYYTPHTTATARADLINKYFSVIPSTAFVMVRSAYYKQQYANSGGTADRLARLGHYNDCFMSGSAGQEGYACYPWPGSCPAAQDWKDTIATDSDTVPVGGETCTDLRNACTSVSNEMAYQGYTFLNTAWWADSSTGKTNFDYWLQLSPSCHTQVRTRMGYRIELVSATVPSSINRQTSFTVSFTVRNVGYAPMMSARPVRIKLLNAATGQELVYWGTTANARGWLPGGQSFTTTATLTVPTWVANVPSVTLALALPDDASGLRSMPEYSVRIASKNPSGADVWSTAAAGVNVLKANIPMSAP
jgi:hypothetical protein